ncbi:hypothetical protein [Nodosilinea nodulosa]|uniref:hypothetical protein n=1 Tax=Nodosilinea nodulosa TaxID=416001 RepID=UPI0002EE2D8E|nr:hypothetical protein [Nodosilinea nodulosa]
MSILLPPQLQTFPDSLPVEGAVNIVVEEGIPIFRASQIVQKRIEALIDKQADDGLSLEEVVELDRYEDIDDYLSFVNRAIRNLYLNQPQPTD